MSRLSSISQHIATTLLLSGLWIVASSLAGCRCCPASNCYYDAIDDISDHKAQLDRFYHPTLDISRAGMPDWCASRLNRKICPCRCNGMSCQPKPILYPSTYRQRYQQFLNEQAAEDRQRKYEEPSSPVPPLPQ